MPGRTPVEESVRPESLGRRRSRGRHFGAIFNVPLRAENSLRADPPLSRIPPAGPEPSAHTFRWSARAGSHATPGSTTAARRAPLRADGHGLQNLPPHPPRGKGPRPTGSECPRCIDAWESPAASVDENEANRIWLEVTVA